jgi:aryl-alcohol dehydrogenase (NADP+)
MDYVRFGKTGMQVSRLCLGMMTYGSKKWREWILEEGEARPFIKRALDAGINFFDTADVYSLGASEEVLGNMMNVLGVRRETVVITTKVCNPMSDVPNDRGLSRKHILDSIDRSLRRLQMDYVDLYQIHRWDPDTPIAETMEALHDVVRAGKARYIGASSMFAWQFIKAQYTADLHGWTRFVSMQNHYNLIYREEEREMIPCCVDQGIAVIPWSPMARGFFAGNHRKGDWGDTTRARTDTYGQSLYYREADFVVADRVQQVAKERGLSGSQIALAWVLAKPYVTAPIIGASRMEHLEESIAALEIELSADEVRRLEEPYVLHPVLGHS